MDLRYVFLLDQIDTNSSYAKYLDQGSLVMFKFEDIQECAKLVLFFFNPIKHINVTTFLKFI